MEATLSSKNQATLPKSVRQFLNLKPATGSSSCCSLIGQWPFFPRSEYQD